MTPLLEAFTARLKSPLQQYRLWMVTWVFFTQYRFPTLRGIGYRFVDLLIVILAFYQDTISAFYRFFHELVVCLCNRCNVIKRKVWGRLVIELMVVKDSLYGFVISALISAGVTVNRWSNVFHISSNRVLRYLAMLPYLVPTLVILYMVSYTSKHELLNLPLEIRPLEYLPLGTSVDHSAVVLKLPAGLRRSYVAIFAAIIAGLFLGVVFNAFCQDVAHGMVQIAATIRPYWEPYLDRLHQIWKAIQVQPRQKLSRMRTVASSYLGFVTPVVLAVIASIWRQVEARSSVLTIAMIFGLSLAVSINDCDCYSIFNFLTTTAIDHDVSLLSLVFGSIRFAADICIWLANCFVVLHKELENFVLENKEGAWVDRADWLESCMCAIVSAAVFYGALSLGFRIWNADICTPIRDAVAGCRNGIAARLDIDVDDINNALKPEERSGNGVPITPTGPTICPKDVEGLPQDTVARDDELEEEVYDFLGRSTFGVMTKVLQDPLAEPQTKQIVKAGVGLCFVL